jgi:hypothetical protein
MEEVKEVKAKKNSRPQASARLTAGQWIAVTDAQAIAKMNHVQFVRYALKLACEQQGIEFPADMPKAGTYERNKVSE